MMSRYRFVFFLLVFIFGLVVLRLFYWQVVRAEDLSNLGQSQYGKMVKLLSRRGDIKTSDGYPLVSDKVSFLVYANPKLVKDKKKTAEILAPLFMADTASVSAKLDTDRLWIALENGIDIDTKNKIKSLSIKGIGFEEQYQRFYPEASIAAHLTGFVGKDEAGDNKGYFGLEGYYDRSLRGKERQILEIQDAFGRPIAAWMDSPTLGMDGRSLVLNIDRTIQFITDERLKKGVEKYGAESGMIAVMDPKTGGILAMSAFPAFDQRSFQDYFPDIYKNPIISSIYEPGSTFKTLIMAAGIDSGVVKPETKCPICAGPIQIGEYSIKTWNDKYYKDTNMIDVIKHSNNTGMVYVGQSLGLSRMLSYFKAFGIGDATGVDLQGEIAPELRSLKCWIAIDLGTASFGQGISVTAIALLDAFSAIANQGARMEPHVVSKIVTADGQAIPIEPKVINKPISAKTAKIMTEILVNAVKQGEAKYLKPKGYRIAGKTGTAQIPISGHYDANKTIASFIGFAPADDPKFSMLVVFDRPTTSIYGAETAAPVFMDIAIDILSYYGVSPTE